MAQLMPLPLTVSCFSKIQIGFTFLLPAHPGSPGKRAIKRVCRLRVCVTVLLNTVGHQKISIMGIIKCLCNGRVSVRPSVCLVDRKQQRCAAGLQLCRGRQISTESCWRRVLASGRYLPPVPERSSGPPALYCDPRDEGRRRLF